MGSSVRVLCVGADMAETATTLEAAGMTPLTFENPDEALERLGDVDCVVSQPRLSFLEELRHQEGTLPVVVLADADTDVREAFEAGATDCVRPTDRTGDGTVLVHRIRNYTGTRTGIQTPRRFVDLFENFPEPTIGYAFEEGEPMFRAVNSAFEEAFEFEATAVLGESINEMLVPDVERETAQDIDDQARDGTVIEQVVRRETATEMRTFTLHNIPVEAQADIDGYAVYVDITERKEREQELENYEAIVETMPIGLFVLDNTGEIVTLNDQMIQMFDNIDQDCRNQRLIDLVEQGRLQEPITREYLARVDEALSTPEDGPHTQRMPGGRQVFTDEAWVENSDGRQCYQVRVSEVDIQDDGDAGYVVLIRDITTRKRREEKLRERETELEQQKESLQTQKSQLEYQNERLDKFASIVSHDLRNPLNVAQGRLEIVLDAVGNDEVSVSADNVGKIQSSLERMGAIIDDALTLARQGKAITETRQVGLGDTVKRAWANVATKEATLDPCEGVAIDSDPDRLLNVFENLFRNAVEHGREDVTVSVGLLADGFYVEDDGSGIPDEEKDAVLEEGFTTARDGTGFGLAIVQDVVRAHGWDITVTDSEAGGARFEITGVTFSWTTRDVVGILSESLGEQKATELVEDALVALEIGRSRFDQPTAVEILDTVAEMDDTSSLATVAAQTAKRQLT